LLPVPIFSKQGGAIGHLAVLSIQTVTQGIDGVHDFLTALTFRTILP